MPMVSNKYYNEAIADIGLYRLSNRYKLSIIPPRLVAHEAKKT